MAGVNQAQQHYCFNLVKLAKDNGIIGQELRKCQDWFLQAADKDAEWKIDRQLKQQDPNRLPFADPWQFLLDSPSVSPSLKKVFLAAQSQLNALRRLSRIARGEATLNTDWFEEMSKAKNTREFMHAANKLAAARAQYSQFNTDIQSRKVDPQFRQWGQRQIEKARKERRKRGKGKNFTSLPRAGEVRSEHKLICALVDWWVRGPYDAPGLMFFRNEALTEFLKIHLPNTNLSPTAVKKVRQQLGLIPVSHKKHFVWDYSLKEASNGNLKSVGYQRRGRKIAFVGELKAKPQSNCR